MIKTITTFYLCFIFSCVTSKASNKDMGEYILDPLSNVPYIDIAQDLQHKLSHTLKKNIDEHLQYFNSELASIDLELSNLDKQ